MFLDTSDCLPKVISPQSQHDRVGVTTSQGKRIVYTRVNDRLVEVECAERCAESKSPSATINYNACENLDVLISDCHRNQKLISQGYLHLSIEDLPTNEHTVPTSLHNVNEQQTQFVTRTDVHPPEWQTMSKVQQRKCRPLHYLKISTTSKKIMHGQRQAPLDCNWEHRSALHNVEEWLEFNDCEGEFGSYTYADVLPDDPSVQEHRSHIGLLSTPLPTSSRMKASAQQLPGTHFPYLYCSGKDSVTTMHIEDCGLYSANVLHRGATKVWTIIHPTDRERFETCLQTLLHLSDDCSSFVRHQSLFIPPSTLRKWKIRFSIVHQKPRDIVITDVNAYHQVRNSGPNVAEAVNFMAECAHPCTAWSDCGSSCPRRPILKDIFYRGDLSQHKQRGPTNTATIRSKDNPPAARDGKDVDSQLSSRKTPSKLQPCKKAPLSLKRPKKGSKSVPQLRPAGTKLREQTHEEEESEEDDGNDSDECEEDSENEAVITERRNDVSNSRGIAGGGTIQEEGDVRLETTGTCSSPAKGNKTLPVSGETQSEEINSIALDRSQDSASIVTGSVSSTIENNPASHSGQQFEAKSDGQSRSRAATGELSGHPETNAKSCELGTSVSGNTDLNIDTRGGTGIKEHLVPPASISKPYLQPYVEDAPEDDHEESEENLGTVSEKSSSNLSHAHLDKDITTKTQNSSPLSETAIFTPTRLADDGLFSNVTTPSSPLDLRLLKTGEHSTNSPISVPDSPDGAISHSEADDLSSTNHNDQPDFQTDGRRWLQGLGLPRTDCERLLMQIAHQDRDQCVIGGVHLSWNDLEKLLPGGQGSRLNDNLLHAIISDRFCRAGYTYEICNSWTPRELFVPDYQYVICLMHDRAQEHWWLVVLDSREKVIYYYDDFERPSVREQTKATVGYDLTDWSITPNKLSNARVDGINCGTFVIAHALELVLPGVPTTPKKLRELFLRIILNTQTPSNVTSFLHERGEMKRPASARGTSRSKTAKVAANYIQVDSIQLNEKALLTLGIACGSHLVALQQWRKRSPFAQEDKGSSEELSELYRIDAKLFRRQRDIVLDRRVLVMEFHKLWSQRVVAKSRQLQRSRNARKAQKIKRARALRGQQECPSGDEDACEGARGKGASEYIFEELFHDVHGEHPAPKSTEYHDFKRRVSSMNVEGKKWNDFMVRTGIHAVLVPAQPIYVYQKADLAEGLTITFTDFLKHEWSRDDFSTVPADLPMDRLTKSRDIKLDKWDQELLSGLSIVDLPDLLGAVGA